MKILLLLLLFEGKVHAYVDPGSGALIWQMLVASLAGALYLLRRLASRFKLPRKERQID